MYMLQPLIPRGLASHLLKQDNANYLPLCSNIAIFKEQYNENEVVFYELDNIDSLSEAIAKAFN